MNAAIVVIGSSNTDMVIKADHLPVRGETILGEHFFMNAGGKGANQAVAASRLGGKVVFITKTGNDIFGRQSAQLLNSEGIDTSYIVSDPKNPSGVALITVDRNGENCIAVCSGANATLNIADLEKARSIIEHASIILMQLEIPLETVSYVASLAASGGAKLVLNPAPYQDLPEDLLKNIFIITPNRKEAEMLSGITVSDTDSAQSAALQIRKRGAKTVIITLGSQGALVLENNTFTTVPATKVNAIDSTAAGDVFNGALAVSLAEGRPVVESTTFACHAAAISVTRMGARSSAPKKHEVLSALLKREEG